ncbi:MAG: rhodanese-like domain-containing protein [Waterburya sp.]
MIEIDVHQLAIRIAEAEENIQLIDVRERNEAAIAFIEGFDLYPLSEFEQWSEKILTSLQPETETLVICHHGVRSAQMCQWLASKGFSNVQNVMGGIDAYSCLVDPTINRY